MCRLLYKNIIWPSTPDELCRITACHFPWPLRQTQHRAKSTSAYLQTPYPPLPQKSGQRQAIHRWLAGCTRWNKWAAVKGSFCMGMAASLGLTSCCYHAQVLREDMIMTSTRKNKSWPHLQSGVCGRKGFPKIAHQTWEKFHGWESHKRVPSSLFITHLYPLKVTKKKALRGAHCGPFCLVLWLVRKVKGSLNLLSSVSRLLLLLLSWPINLCLLCESTT